MPSYKIKPININRFYQFSSKSAYLQRKKLNELSLRLFKKQRQIERLVKNSVAGYRPDVLSLDITDANAKNRVRRYAQLKAIENQFKQYLSKINIKGLPAQTKINIDAFINLVNNTQVKMAWDSEGNYDTIEDNVANSIGSYAHLLIGIGEKNFPQIRAYIQGETGLDIDFNEIRKARMTKQGLRSKLIARGYRA